MSEEKMIQDMQDINIEQAEKIKELLEENTELMTLMDSLVNFDHHSDEDAKAHFIDLIQNWYKDHADEMHEFRMKRRGSELQG